MLLSTFCALGSFKEQKMRSALVYISLITDMPMWTVFYICYYVLEIRFILGVVFRDK